MTAVMKGVRVLEVADHTFVPAASALLADWGAEVIKVEHVERGDAMRGLASSGTVDLGDDVHVLLEHSNRGQAEHRRSTSPATTACDILYDLARDLRRLPHQQAAVGAGQAAHRRRADPGPQPRHHLRPRHRPGRARARRRPRRLRLARLLVPGRHRHRPDAPRGPDVRSAASRPRLRRLHRCDDDRRRHHGRAVPPERTGEATIVDVSLLGTGIWSQGAALALSLQFDVPWAPAGASAPSNPLVGNFRTKDGRFVSLCCLQAAKYWPGPARSSGSRSSPRPPLRRPPSLMTNGAVGDELLQRRLRQAHARRVARAPGGLQRAVGDRAGHARGGRRPPDRGQRLRQRLPARPTARRSSSPPRPSSTTASLPSRPGARIQRARRRHPRRAGSRHGRHPRPQGARSRRLSAGPPHRCRCGGSLGQQAVDELAGSARPTIGRSRG